MLTIKIEGQITVDDCVAEILEYVVGLDPKVFREKFGEKYSDDQIRARFAPMRQELNKIIDARKTAIDAVNEKSVRVNQPKASK